MSGVVSSNANSQESAAATVDTGQKDPKNRRGKFLSVLQISIPSDRCQILACTMEDRKRKIWIMQCLLLLSIGCFVSQLHASDDVKFDESFDEKFEGRWVVSEKEDYNGVWKHSKSEGHDDYGLLVSEKAKKHAIAKVLEEPAELKDETVVLQFEVRLQEGLECGGAYIKYLRPQNAGWIPKNFDNESPYTIMFGPDKCGATNKVHFILKHENPKTGKYIEHHLKYPPSVPSDKLTHVYTAILKPDNVLRILIDGDEKKKANFLSEEDFEPSLIPPKTIPDPDDRKPEDWDERAKIPDSEATKPEDWDEDAAMEIEDEEAEKPEGWLDDEPEEVDDPEATKPEDWDDEEYGEWEAPKIDNPKCAEAPGCGEWKKPMKRNPAYKGKWQPPLIENPNYKGIWKAQLIGNPEYFEVDKPNFDPIAAIGIEIWTMQDGILFDNILIASNEKVAQLYRETAWKPKFDVEKEKHKAEEPSSNGLKGVEEQMYNLEKFISENYFEKYDSLIDSKFNSFIENEIPHDLSKSLQENNYATPASSVLHQNFIGEGSHRRLYSYLRFRVRPEFLYDLTRQSCVVVLIERLQSGVFADPFELQHLVQHGVFTRAAVFGDANLEFPSFQSNRSVVEIHIDVSSKVFWSNKNELEVDLEVPLHARYQPLGPGFSRVEFGQPDVFMCCSTERNAQNRSCSIMPTDCSLYCNSAPLVWDIPCGIREHAGFVSIITFVSAVVAVLFIVSASVCYSDKSVSDKLKHL